MRTALTCLLLSLSFFSALPLARSAQQEPTAPAATAAPPQAKAPAATAPATAAAAADRTPFQQRPYRVTVEVGFSGTGA
ncbi:MAG: hypothetical protein ACKPJJ_32965, partial [Planctomycetaceae bacterium]